MFEYPPSPSRVRLVVVVAAFTAALFPGACAETRLNRALTPPDPSRGRGVSRQRG